MIPMKQIIIRRLPRLMGYTPGVLYDEKEPFAVTLELDWKNNQPFISCIPKGEYTSKRYSSAKYPNTWRITGVDGRDLVLFHWGSFINDTEGCVLVAEKFSKLYHKGIKEFGVAESKALPHEGFNELMDRTVGLDEFKLIIEEATSWES